MALEPVRRFLDGLALDVAVAVEKIGGAAHQLAHGAAPAASAGMVAADGIERVAHAAVKKVAGLVDHRQRPKSVIGGAGVAVFVGRGIFRSGVDRITLVSGVWILARDMGLLQIACGRRPKPACKRHVWLLSMVAPYPETRELRGEQRITKSLLRGIQELSRVPCPGTPPFFPFPGTVEAVSWGP